MDDVLARRLAYAFSALLLLVVIVSSVATRENRRTQAVAPPLGGPAPAPAPQATGQMPPDRVVRARVGDVVSVAVRTPQPDTATITAVGASAITSPDLPGTLEFVATDPGRYPVLLEDSGGTAGTVVISSNR
jgi:hypothetical protein